MVDRGVDTCRCGGCQGLRERYRKDPALLRFYARQLLLRGWAGSTDDIERGYLASHSSWYRAQQEQGRRLAQAFPGRPPEHLRRERFAVIGEASAPPAEGSANQGLPRSHSQGGEG